MKQHPRDIARAAVARRRGQFLILPAEFVMLLISSRPKGQQHQVWPIDGPHSLRSLMADCYVNGVFAGDSVTTKSG